MSLHTPDLTKFPPRSPRVRLGGYVILPRMLDKGRAAASGKNGEVLLGFSGEKSLVKTQAGRRAYSPGPGESVARGDRRGRELGFGSPSPPLASPCE